VTEDYVRPPLVALEPPSASARRWRRRAALTLTAVAAIVGLLLLGRALLGGGEGNPGVGSQPRQVVGSMPYRG
jgi:hypothetical protein